ncbi:efflux RND transporter periplasmic adaptor subunit [Porphyromonas pogonae]|uniref:efflux RND transporter periplasmic adaptor subunit n=1 Tax=Porphyromonas pogonae TaxID=867595 RepID=UPI002E78C5E2|nr:efflux RND transporter periplasmic adaptor subunit [Porphyromonas pogonae]
MKKFFRIFRWVILGLLVILTFGYLWSKSRPKAKEYEIETVKQEALLETKSVLTGTIEARDEVAVKPQLNGIISEVLHKAGDFVQAGDIIAKITVIPDMMQVNNGYSRLTNANITFNTIKEKYLRDKSLYEKGIIAREEYETSKADYDQKKEDLSNASDALQIMKTGISQRSAKESSTLVKATISGKILSIPVKVGNSVIQANTFNEGTTIASIANMEDLLFIGKVDETEIGNLQIGMPMRITIGAFGKETFPATIEYIAPKGENTTGATLFEVKASVKIGEKAKQLRAGYSANAEIITKSVKNVLAVPEACIEFKGDSTFVEIVKQEKPELKTQRKLVKTGASDGVKIQIIEGLKAGQKVRGNEKQLK